MITLFAEPIVIEGSGMQVVEVIDEQQYVTCSEPVVYVLSFRLPIVVDTDYCYLEGNPPYEQPPYVCRLHPRRDYQRRPYWLRIRSNPHRRNYH